MNFQPELADKVMDGEKTVTRRLASDNPRSPWFRDRCWYEEGKVFTVNPGRGKKNIGRAKVVRCDFKILGGIGDAEAKREVFGSAREFGEAWKAINGSYDPGARVWRIEFEVCR